MGDLLDKILQRLREEREKEKQRREEERKAYQSFMPKTQSSRKSAGSSHGGSIAPAIKTGKAAQDKAQKEEWDLYSKYIPRPQKAVMREEAREINNTVKRENAYKNIQNSDLFESWTKKARAIGLSGQGAFDWASEQYNNDLKRQTLAKRTNAFELMHPDIESKYADKPDLLQYAMYAGEKIKEGLDKGRQEQKKAEEEEKSAYNQYIPAKHNDNTVKKESIFNRYLSPDSLETYNPANDFYYGGDYKTERSKLIQDDLNTRNKKLTELENTDFTKQDGYVKNTTLNGAPDFLDKQYNNQLYIDYNATNSETEAYTKLTQNEIDNYNFVKNKYGSDSQITKDYADHLIYLGSGRYEKDKAAAIKSPQTKIGSVLFGYATGGNYYSQGLHALINKAENNISPVADNAHQQKYEAELKNPDSKMNIFLSSIGYSAGYMTIPVIIAALTKNPQSYYASFGASIWGNAFNESRQENKSIEQSTMYATINTAMELSAQQLLEKTVGTFIPHATKNSMLYQNLSKKMADRPVLSVLIQSFVRDQGEGIEEGLQTLFDPIVRNTVFGENNKFGENWRDALYSYGVGVVTSSILGSHADVMGLKDVYIAKKFNLKENYADFMSSLASDKVFMTSALKEKFIDIGKEMTDEELFNSIEEINRISGIKIGGKSLADISSDTKGMSPIQKLKYLYDYMHSEKYINDIEKIKAQEMSTADSSEGGEFGGRGEEDANVEADNGKQNALSSDEIFSGDESNGVDTDNALSENNNISADKADEAGGVSSSPSDAGNINKAEENNVIKGENDIANGDGMGYKGDKGNLFDTKNIPKLATTTDYYMYVTEIAKRQDITNDEKVHQIQNAFNLAQDKTDINCPIDAKYIKEMTEDGIILYSWPAKYGLVPESIKSISREDPLPSECDRTGSINGSNFTDIPKDREPYTESERGIPYLKNPYAEHQGTFNTEDYFDVIDAIINTDLNTMNKIRRKLGLDIMSKDELYSYKMLHDQFINSVETKIKNIKVTYGFKGIVNSWEELKGGAPQFIPPFTGDILEELGLLKILKKE